ncbi:positive regulator of late transcription [Enterobacteriaceae bacterium YMB-R22]|uniref:Mor transcription activator family protein n=1 Tax=Tenebrionicola larvae TaxID=2815733 RepID=UPI00201191C9|nr:Mor transcription activator family protein [Tenebrionicola larvae]MBV4411339.1 positive regulator of late transcription [Tenebrionicola larvae]
MTEQQTDMFNNDPKLAQVLEHIDKIPAADLEAAWPQSLVALVDVMASELTRQGVPCNPRAAARKLAVAMSHYMGGRAYYLPTGVRMLNAIRDDMIYCEFDGRNIEQLRRKYNLSQPQTYNILAQQRRLHARRRQADMFA